MNPEISTILNKRVMRSSNYSDKVAAETAMVGLMMDKGDKFSKDRLNDITTKAAIEHDIIRRRYGDYPDKRRRIEVEAEAEVEIIVIEDDDAEDDAEDDAVSVASAETMVTESADHEAHDDHDAYIDSDEYFHKHHYIAPDAKEDDADSVASAETMVTESDDYEAYDDHDAYIDSDEYFYKHHDIAPDAKEAAKKEDDADSVASIETLVIDDDEETSDNYDENEVEEDERNQLEHETFQLEAEAMAEEAEAERSEHEYYEMKQALYDIGRFEAEEEAYISKLVEEVLPIHDPVMYTQYECNSAAILSGMSQKPV